MLPVEARQVLARLELIACAQAQSFDKEGGRSADRPSRPAGPDLKGDGDLVAFWRAQMVSAGDSLQKVVAEAEEALEGLLRSPEPEELTPEPVADRNARMLKEGEGFTVSDVLLNFRDMTHRDVINLRTNDGRDGVYGRKLKPETVYDRSEVLRMHGDGYTPTQIAKIAGKTKQAVSQMIKRAA
jgi:hypothetical protein